MAMRRFYINQELEIGYNASLPEEEAEHARKSLRLETGDNVLVFDGKSEFLAELTEVTKKGVSLKVIEKVREASASSTQITLIQALIKPANFELVLQKATELGVDNVIPMTTEYGQQKPDFSPNKLKRMEKIVLEASKQSERITIPEILNAEDYSEVIEAGEKDTITLLFTLARDSEKAVSLDKISAKLKDSKQIRLVIGPEGGFSPGELQKAEDAGLSIVSMGEHVLKSETAAISALTLINYVLG